VFEKVRLGKHDYKFDEKTLKLARYFSPTIIVPHKFDFDRGRSAFPLAMWGNDAWGNCVKVAQANEIVRLERLETRQTVRIQEIDVVAAYKAETGSTSPGDPNDTGLVMLDNNRLWRKEGFPLRNRRYNICAFGELDPNDHAQLRAAAFLLHGVQFGFALPRACQQMGATWDYPISKPSGPEWTPGGWGGHAVFSKRYDDNGMEILTWGSKVYVTNRFIEHYCDEAWAVVDDFDQWRKRPEIDINGIIKHLNDVGSTNIER
jgi:hypothetical protein